MEHREDDGSLSFLNIPRDENNKNFHCDVTTQKKLEDETFWVVDFVESVPTRYSKEGGKSLVKIKFNLEDEEKDAKKFFTGSSEIRYILKKVKELNAFPRKVTLKCHGNVYYFE